MGVILSDEHLIIITQSILLGILPMIAFHYGYKAGKPRSRKKPTPKKKGKWEPFSNKGGQFDPFVADEEPPKKFTEGPW